MLQKKLRPGAVAIVSANGTEDRGFESRQGVGLKRFMHCNAVLCKFIRIAIVFIGVKNRQKIFKI
jgi:hypothetical protein